LFSAVENDDTDMIDLLVSNGADLKAKNREGRSLLSAAVAANCPKAAEVLLRMGLPITIDDLTDAALSSDVRCLEILLQHGADPNAKNLSMSGSTALMLAALSGRTASERILLTHGADPNIKDADGRTALSTAAYYGQETAVRILLDAGADPNADPRTLSNAQKRGSDLDNKVAELLVAHGAK
jgi:ankyrin repeat protein